MRVIKVVLLCIISISFIPAQSQVSSADSLRILNGYQAFLAKRAEEVKRQDSIKQARKDSDRVADSLKPWHVGGIITATLSQVSLTNWAAGGENSVGLVAIALAHANYHYKNFIWLNNIDLEYGFQQIDAEPLEKSTDKMEATTNLGYSVFKNTYAGILGDFTSQFAPGYQYPAKDSVVISKFMAPAYLSIAAGLTYKPVKALSVFLSPATLRYTFVEDHALADAGDFGVSPGSTLLVQAGAYFTGIYSGHICKGVDLNTQLNLFSNYLKNPQDIVVDWTTLIAVKVTKAIAITFNTELIYDQNILIPLYNSAMVVTGEGPRTQFKELLGVGLAFTLSNSKYF